MKEQYYSDEVTEWLRSLRETYPKETPAPTAQEYKDYWAISRF